MSVESKHREERESARKKMGDPLPPLKSYRSPTH